MSARRLPRKRSCEMLGNQPKGASLPDRMAKLAETRWLEGIQDLGDSPAALLLSLASDLVYECNYKLATWQKLLFPVVSWRICRLQSAVRRPESNAKAEQRLREVVAKLEFGNKRPPVVLISQIRLKILEHAYSSYQVRQAFHSIALKKVKTGWRLRSQPVWLSKVAPACQWVMALAAGVMFLALLLDVCGWIPCTHWFLSFAAQDAVMACAVFYILGSQWANGYRVLANILPTARSS